MESLQKLIGAKLISIDEETIKVEKDGKVYEIDIIQDEGDCCGYNEVESKLLISDNSKPIITNIQEDSCFVCGNTCLLTFFGEYKPIATLKSISRSGSGWEYGACVSLHCDALNIDEIVTEW